MNSFLQYSGDDKQQDSRLGSGRYYARFSQAETGVKSPRKGEANLWILEAFDAQWFDANPPPDSSSPEELFPYYEGAQLFALEILHRPEISNQYGALVPIETAVQADEDVETWFSLQAGPNLTSEDATDGVAMTVYSNLYAAGIAVAVREIAAVSQSTQAQLNRAVTIDDFPDATEDELDTALASFTSNHLDWAVVYDVGQGGSNGFCTSGGPVEGYFDLGGGVLRNTFTFPTALRNFCFSTAPPVILSHWDWDHWSSANRNTASYNLDWIAPRQKVGAIQTALITNISHHGRLLLVSASFTAKWRGQIYLESCTGSGRNHSGIALTFSEMSNGMGNLMLFPGDAKYSVIPSFGAKKYLSVVVPHHGGNMGTPLAPNYTGGTGPRLAYSYGLGNKYGHAATVTRQRHSATGWTDPRISPGVTPFPVRETENRGATSGLGHILLPWKSVSAVPLLPCGHGCQLQPQQL